MNEKERIHLLEEQVEALNTEKRSILEAIELTANLGNFRVSLNKIEDPIIIIKETATRICQLLDFKAFSFYLVNEEDSNFYQEYTEPREYSERIDTEVNQLIEDKTFFWALSRNKPVVISSIDKNDRIVLHSMNTSSRTRGIFVGILSTPVAEITDLSLFLFSITIISCSNSLESFELYKQIRDRNTKLNESIEKYRALFEQAANSIILYDIDTRTPVEFNNKAHEDLGYTREEFNTLRIEDYDIGHTLEDVKIFMKKTLETGTESFGTLHKRKKGEIRNIIVNAKAIHLQGKNYILTILSDVTDLKNAEIERIRLEQQLRQSQKMEAIGTLAGGVAHDFNNILAIILGYVELSLLDIPENMVRTRNNMTQLILAVNRAQKLVSQILTFSRRGEEQVEPIGVNNVIRETLLMLRSTLPTTIEIHQEITEEPLMIMGNVTQMHQVIMNLCANGAQAIEGKRGVINVEVKRVDLEKEEIIEDQHIKKGSYVRITVADTGHGIEPEHLPKVFDPYFTTKDPGKGTGLGLAVVHGIVESSNGYITINSRIGDGTEVNVWIPIFDISTMSSILTFPVEKDYVSF